MHIVSVEFTSNKQFSYGSDLNIYMPKKKKKKKTEWDPCHDSVLAIGEQSWSFQSGDPLTWDHGDALHCGCYKALWMHRGWGVGGGSSKHQHVTEELETQSSEQLACWQRSCLLTLQVALFFFSPF